MECIISRFNTSVEILKSSATYNFAWQKSGGAMAPPAPPVLPGLPLTQSVVIFMLDIVQASLTIRSSGRPRDIIHLDLLQVRVIEQQESPSRDTFLSYSLSNCLIQDETGDDEVCFTSCILLTFIELIPGCSAQRHQSELFCFMIFNLTVTLFTIELQIKLIGPFSFV